MLRVIRSLSGNYDRTRTTACAFRVSLSCQHRLELVGGPLPRPMDGWGFKQIFFVVCVDPAGKRMSQGVEKILDVECNHRTVPTENPTVSIECPTGSNLVQDNLRLNMSRSDEADLDSTQS